MGILSGLMLAGGLEGVGLGTAAVGKEWNARLAEEARQEAIGQREESLARLNNAAADTRQAALIGSHERMHTESETGHDRRLGVQIGATQALHQIDRTFQLDLANQTEKNALRRHEETLKHTEKLAGMQIGANRELHQPGMDLQREQLNNIKAVSVLRSAYADAIKNGDTEAAKSLPKRIEALGYSGDTKDTAGLIAIAGTAGKLATSIDASPEDKKIYGDIMRTALSAAMGQKDVAVPKASPPQAAIDLLKKDPNTAAQFDAKYGAGASTEFLKPSPAAPARPRVIGDRTPRDPFTGADITADVEEQKRKREALIRGAKDPITGQ